ncbi:MAG: hypothetical protein P9M03_10865 [Candidatus Theseobacter exili]|nr:hypothetical protein [Candidatus Theseobacter exili]
MKTSINETIKVGAVFENTKARPVWFVWKKSKYAVLAITYQWKTRTGRETQHHFAAQGPEDLYELVYNSGTLTWTLATVETE